MLNFLIMIYFSYGVKCMRLYENFLPSSYILLFNVVSIVATFKSLYKMLLISRMHLL